ncbi:MAG: enoyl-CoA hydratase/isomerase family protein, partial [Alphaproteobacteria bacterium]|nr:enoyl-CoA hydratase/isomerase family protein [Alphaproteobacteria bacterium]
EVAQELAQQVAKNPPLAVRTTVRTRRWYMQRLTREAQFVAEPFRLYLTEDFQEAARAFTEKRPPGRFKGR